MKITEVKTILVGSTSTREKWKNWVFVKIDTNEGIVGVGEATVEGKEKTVATAVEELARYLVGKDPFQIEQHWQTMYRSAFWRGGIILNSAISGVEQALWDIVGKKLDTPVYNLLGGPCRNKIRVYTHVSGGTPEELAENAVQLVKLGYTAVKFGPYGIIDERLDQRFKERHASIIKEAVTRVKAVRNAVGDDVDVMLDLHGRLNPYMAIALAKEFEEFKPLFFEEPVPPENVDALIKVASHTSIPIATGERLFTKFGFREVIEKQAVDIIQPDPSHAGGILECKKIAAMAEAHYISIAPHNPRSPVMTAVVLHLDACTPNFLIQEHVRDDKPPRNEVLVEPLVFEKGFMKLPTKPGLGIELNEKALAKYPFKAGDSPRLYREDDSITEW